MKTIPLLLLSILLSSCVLNPTAQRLEQDKGLQQAAILLTRDFLDAQMRGENGSRFGVPGRFYDLAEYHIEGCGSELGRPAVFFRARGGNQLGAYLWKDCSAMMRHDAKAEAEGDRYMGLNLTSVGDSVAQSLRN